LPPIVKPKDFLTNQKWKEVIGPPVPDSQFASLWEQLHPLNTAEEEWEGEEPGEEPEEQAEAPWVEQAPEATTAPVPAQRLGLL